MQKILVLLLLTCTTSAFAEWTWQNTLPQGETLRDVQIVNSTTIYAAGNSGTFLKSIDNGESWVNQNLDGWIYALYFIDEFTGWIVGIDDFEEDELIFKTIDGGQTWTLQWISSGRGLTDIQFINENTGWVCGRSGTLSVVSVHCHSAPIIQKMVSGQFWKQRYWQ